MKEDGEERDKMTKSMSRGSLRSYGSPYVPKHTSIPRMNLHHSFLLVSRDVTSQITYSVIFGMEMSCYMAVEYYTEAPYIVTHWMRYMVQDKTQFKQDLYERSAPVTAFGPSFSRVRVYCRLMLATK